MWTHPDTHTSVAFPFYTLKCQVLVLRDPGLHHLPHQHPGTVKYDLAETVNPGRAEPTQELSLRPPDPSSSLNLHCQDLESPFKRPGQHPTRTPLLVTSAQATAAHPTPMAPLSFSSGMLSMPASHHPFGKALQKGELA